MYAKSKQNANRNKVPSTTLETKLVGRPSLPENERASVGTIRLTPMYWDRLRALGMPWLKQQIDSGWQKHMREIGRQLDGGRSTYTKSSLAKKLQRKK